MHADGNGGGGLGRREVQDVELPERAGVVHGRRGQPGQVVLHGLVRLGRRGSGFQAGDDDVIIQVHRGPHPPRLGVLSRITIIHLDAGEAWVADERDLQPRARRRDVHRRAQPDHGHDVAVEVRLAEQPPRGAHRLAHRLQVTLPRCCRRRRGGRHRALLLPLLRRLITTRPIWPGRGLRRRAVGSSSSRVYRDHPLPQRGRRGAGAAGIRRRGRIHRRMALAASVDAGEPSAVATATVALGAWALPESGQPALAFGLQLRVDPLDRKSVV